MTHRTRIKVGMAYNLGLLQLSSSLKPVQVQSSWNGNDGREGQPCVIGVWTKVLARCLHTYFLLSTRLAQQECWVPRQSLLCSLETNLDFWVKFPNKTCSQLFPSQQIAWKLAMEKETGLGPVEIHSRTLVMLSSWHCSILFTIVILDSIKLAIKDMKQLLICVHGSPWMPMCSFVCTQMFPLFHIATARETQ